MDRRMRIAVGTVATLWMGAAGVGVGVAHDSTPTHTVRQGDTLSQIAQDRGTTAQALASVNKISNPDRLTVGQTLKITKPPVKKASTKPSKPAKPTIQEDDPRWDCRKHGNKICGPNVTLPDGGNTGPKGYHCHPAFGPDGLACAKGNNLYGYSNG